MSSIDNRVVSIEFDNAKFEKNVKESVTTLKHLDKTLNGMSGSVKSLENIDNAIGNMNFSKLENDVDKLANKFDLLGTIGKGAMMAIGSSLANLAVEAVKSLSMIDQIGAGWTKYGEKTNSVQTIMSATGKSIGEVNEQLEKLNWYTDETSYNYVDMANNIAKFTSQGIDLKSAVTSMEGIANWAAQAGQNAATATRAMYNISQAMGVGYMGTMDWKSIELANMATDTFKKNVLETAAKLGTLQKVSEGVYKTIGKGTEVTSNKFRDALSEGWFTSGVMQSIFIDYGRFNDKLYELANLTDLTATELIKMVDAEKEGTLSLSDYEDAVKDSTLSAAEFKAMLKGLGGEEFALSRESFKMAQEAKTFEDAINSFKDAYSTTWMNIFETIFGNYEKAKKLWTDFANTLYDVFVEPVNALDDLLTDAFGSDWDKFVKEVNAAGVSTDDFCEALAAAGNMSREAFDTAVKKAGGYEQAVQQGIITTNMLNTAIDNLSGTIVGSTVSKNVEEEIEKLNKALMDSRMGYLTGVDRKKYVEEAGWNYEYFQDLIIKTRQGYKVSQKDLENMGKTFKAVGVETEAAGNKLRQLKNEIADMNLDSLSGGDLFRSSLSNLMELLKNVSSAINTGLSDIIPDTLAESIYRFLEKLSNVTNKIKETFAEGTPIFEALRNTAGGIFSILKAGIGIIGSIISLGLQLVNAVLVPISKVLAVLIGKTGYLISFLISKLSAVKKIFKYLTNAIGFVSGFLNTLADALVDWLSKMKFLDLISKSLQTFIGYLVVMAGEVSKFLTEVYNSFKQTQFYRSLVSILSDIEEYFIGLHNSIVEFFRGYTLNDLGKEFRMFGAEIENIWEQINQYLFSEDFKNTEIYKFLQTLMEGFEKCYDVLKGLKKAGFDKIAEGISSVGSTIREAIPNFDSLSTLGKIGSVLALAGGYIVTELSNLWQNVKNIVKNMDWGQLLNDALQKIRDAKPVIQSVFNNVLAYINDAIDKITDPSFIPNLQKKLQNMFNNIKVNIPIVFDLMKQALPSLLEGIKKLGDIAGKVIGVMFTGSAAIIKAGAAFVQSFFKGIVSAMPGFDGFYTALKEAFAKFRDGFTKVVLSDDFWNRILDISKIGLMWSITLQKLQQAGSLGIFATTLTKLLKQYSGLGKIVKKIFNTINGIFGQVKGAVASIKHVNNSKALINVGKSLLLLVAAIAGIVGIIYIMSKMLEQNEAGITKATHLVGTILLGVAAVFAGLYAVTALVSKEATEKVKTTFKDIAILFVGIAGSLWIFAKALEEINTINDLEGSLLKVRKILLPIAAIIAIITVLSKGFSIVREKKSSFLSTSSELTGLGLAFIGIAGAIYIIVRTLKKIKDLGFTDKDVNQISKLVRNVGAALAVVALAMGSGNIKFGNGVALILAAKAFELITDLIKEIKTMLDEAEGLNLFYATTFVVGLMVLLSTLAAAIGKSGFDLKTGGGLIAMVAAIGILGLVIKSFAKVPFDQFSKEYTTISACILALILLSKWISDIKIDGTAVLTTGAGMVFMAGALLLLAYACKEFNSVEWEDLGKAGAGLAGLAIAMWLIKDASTNLIKAGIGMIAMAGALYVVALAFEKIQGVNLTDIQLASIVVAIMGLSTLSFIAGQYGKQILIGAAGMAAIGVALGIIALVIKDLAPVISLYESISNEAIHRVGVIVSSLFIMVGLIALAIETCGIKAGGAIAAGLVTMAGIIGLIAELGWAVSKLVEPLKYFDMINKESFKKVNWLIGSITVLVGVLGALVMATGGMGIGAILAGAAIFSGICGLIIFMAYSIEQFGEAINKIADVASKMQELDMSTFIFNVEQLLGLFSGSSALKTSLIGSFNVKGIKSVTDGITTLSEALTTTKFKEMLGLSGKFGTLASGLEKLLETLRSKLNIGSMFSGIKSNGIKDALEDIASGVTSFGTAWTNSGTGYLDFVNSSDKISSLGQAYTDAASKIKQACDDMKTAITNMANSLSNNFDSAGRNAIRKFASAISSGSSSVYTAMRYVITSAQNAASSGYNGFFNVGVNIVRGMYNGIVANAQNIYNVCYNIAANAVIAAKRAAAIKSPSREFYKIGAYMGEGLVLGIKNQYDNVYDSSYDLAKTAVSAAEMISSAVEEAMSSDLEPVITPVLDLSTLKTSANQIDSILGNQTLSTRGISITAGKISGQRLEGKIQNELSGPQTVKFDSNQLTQLISATRNNPDVNVSVNFEGSLAQLASVLQPAIAKETNRRGMSLINA